MTDSEADKNNEPVKPQDFKPSDPRKVGRGFSASGDFCTKCSQAPYRETGVGSKRCPVCRHEVTLY